ncbi:MAG: hypothetical protein Q8941_14185 [Bacteroidota bacterium]|nr:hypothetical protein [Bacteroidota bacterium]
MKQSLFFISLLVGVATKSQELYVYTEPASNIPAYSLSVKLSADYMPPQPWHDRFMQRYVPEIRFGVNKKWNINAGGSFGDMHTNNFAWESLFLYSKYRFLSKDKVHEHFRMAAFAEASYSRVPFHQDEVNLEGDKSGVTAGVIATQLWNKFALSATISHTQVLDKSRNDKIIVYNPSRIYQVISYSLSGGYLLLPLEYRDYRQTNLNLYAELLSQQSLDRKAYYIDLAPAVQLIFNSTTKFNIGYRFRLSGTMQRMATTSWLISVERIFLNSLKKRK